MQEPRNLPVLPTQKPCYEPLIIGLYDGGARFHCNVFHPGGVCMMRDDSEGEVRTGGSVRCAGTCSSR